MVDPGESPLRAALLCLLCGCASPHQGGQEAEAPYLAAAGREPSPADFAAGDHAAVAAMLRDVPAKFRSPYNIIPTSRAVTILIVCRVESVYDGAVGVQCLSRGPELDLAIDDRLTLYYQPRWAEEEFGVASEALAVGEVRTCVVHGSGFGGELWKRFLIFPGPAPPR
ncbi:MAG: hypothetical protein H6838_20245 [Planctomycetes bacterium]|nr:hypothetical protein [Planctomycetota bacterium]MCB9887827.1 hypothetical protein [Planctomycetota bacterium]